MIAKKGWFSRRKYGGWGFFPKSWQGWVYMVVLVLPFLVMAALKASAEIQLIVSAVWGVVILATFFDMAASIEKDERERIHEAIAERNAMWALLTVLIVGAAYEFAANAVRGKPYIDPIIIIAVVAALVVKAVSNLYLDRKD